MLPARTVKERCAQEHSGKLKVQQAESGKSRSLRRNVARLNTSVMRLEEDMEKLERVFPQACASCARVTCCESSSWAALRPARNQRSTVVSLGTPATFSQPMA